MGQIGCFGQPVLGVVGIGPTVPSSEIAVIVVTEPGAGRLVHVIVVLDRAIELGAIAATIKTHAVIDCGAGDRARVEIDRPVALKFDNLLGEIVFVTVSVAAVAAHCGNVVHAVVSVIECFGGPAPPYQGWAGFLPCRLSSTMSSALIEIESSALNPISTYPTVLVRVRPDSKCTVNA